MTRLCQRSSTQQYQIDSSDAASSAEERKMLDENNQTIQESSCSNSRLDEYRDLPETNL